MPTDRTNQDRFDEVLGQALRGHSEPVPADFTARVMREIREAQQGEILAQVVLQERLALTGCIAFGAATIIAALVFPGRIATVFQRIAGSFTEQVGALLGKIPQAVEAVSSEWQFYAILAVAFGFAICSLVELFVGDRLRLT